MVSSKKTQNNIAGWAANRNREEKKSNKFD